jgi:hypothetical protein
MNWLKSVSSSPDLVIPTQSLAASAVATLRPTLQKAAKKGVEAMKKAALQNAERNKLIMCQALLKEVS